MKKTMLIAALAAMLAGCTSQPITPQSFEARRIELDGTEWQKIQFVEKAYTKEDVDRLIDDVEAKIDGISVTETDPIWNAEKDNYATKEDIPDVSNFASKEEIPQPVTDYVPADVYSEHRQAQHEMEQAMMSDINSRVRDLDFQEAMDTIENTYATKEEIPDVSNLATKEEIPDVSNFVPADVYSEHRQAQHEMEQAMMSDINSRVRDLDFQEAMEEINEEIDSKVSWQMIDVDGMMLPRYDGEYDISYATNAISKPEGYVFEPGAHTAFAPDSRGGCLYLTLVGPSANTAYVTIRVVAELGTKFPITYLSLGAYQRVCIPIFLRREQSVELEISGSALGDVRGAFLEL